MKKTSKWMKRMVVTLLTGAMLIQNLCADTYDVKAVEIKNVDTKAEDSKETAVSDSNFIELPEGIIDYQSVEKPCGHFLVESMEGMYFLNDNVLSFLSLKTYETEVVYTFDKVNSFYEQNDKLYVLGEQQYEVFDLIGQEMVQTVSLTYSADEAYEPAAIGADTLGRVYIAANNWNSSYLYLYSDDGTFLSHCGIVDAVYSFEAFDSTNGKFYVEAYNNSLYWGYPGVATRILKFGTVEDNTIKYHEDFIDAFIDVKDAYRHQGNIDLLGNEYIVINSTYEENLKIYDAEVELYKRYMTIDRKNDESACENAEDLDSVGVRAVYGEERNSVIAYTQNKKIVEYDPLTGSRLREYTAKHCVFNMFMMEDNLLVLEKDGEDYYLETVDWSDVDSIQIKKEKDSMRIGESQQLTVETGRMYETGPFVWNSSDEKILSVTEDGTAIAWKAGSAVITCISLDGTLQAQCTITVEEGALVTGEHASVKTDGAVSENIHKNLYTRYGAIVNSYMVENEDQTFTRVEYLGGTDIIVEQYSAEYELLESNYVQYELSRFGGFYSGKNYNYIVFGQGNPDENDECEVMRVVKYSKDWKRLDAASVYGADTTIPFNFGSLRMTENDGKLYIHTCHQKYTSANDGQRHQENMTFVLEEDSMSISRIDAGTVSHSFNQFVQTDGTYIYRLDHGDAYPRAVYISRVDVQDTAEKTGIDPLRIYGEYGDNETGVSIGGFELSKENCLVVGNSVDQSDSLTYNAYGQRNIFLTVTDKEMENSQIVWLTDYEESDYTTPCTPQLVKLSDEQYLVMWEEQDTKTYEYTMRLVTVDSQGNVTSNMKTCDYQLSDCQPIVTRDGMVQWYVTDGEQMTIYKLNPYKLTDYVEENKNQDDEDKEDAGNSGEDIGNAGDNTGENAGESGDLDKDNQGDSDDKQDNDNQDNNPDNENQDNENQENDNSGNTGDVTQDVLKGDMDKDGVITLNDAQIALKVALKIISVEDDDIGDMDGDCEITLKDAQKILRRALHIE